MSESIVRDLASAGWITAEQGSNAKDEEVAGRRCNLADHI